MLLAFRLTVVKGGEPIEFPLGKNGKPKFSEVRVSTPATNAGNVYIGNSCVNAKFSSLRYAVASGKTFNLKLSTLEDLWLDADNDGDALDILTEIQ